MPTIRDIQEMELSILKDFHDMCEENCLQYCLAYGSMLGAVRHHGFIPWDDDVDVFMPVSDLKKLKSAAYEFADKGLFLQMPETDIQMPYVMYKIRKNGTEMKDSISREVDIHQGIWIDIFPYTYAAKGSVMKKLQTVLLKILQSYRCRYYHAHLHPDKPVHRLLTKLPNKASLLLDKCLEGMVCALGRKYSSEYFLLTCGDQFFLPRTLLDEKTLYPFENAEFWGMKDGDTYLRHRYGDDYMTPKQWGHIDDYSEVIL